VLSEDPNGIAVVGLIDDVDAAAGLIFEVDFGAIEDTALVDEVGGDATVDVVGDFEVVIPPTDFNEAEYGTVPVVDVGAATIVDDAVDDDAVGVVGAEFESRCGVLNGVAELGVAD
jgi:hypothetical protein